MEYLLILGVLGVCYLLKKVLEALDGVSNTVARMERESDSRYHALNDRVASVEKGR